MKSIVDKLSDDTQFEKRRVTRLCNFVTQIIILLHMKPLHLD